MILVTVGSATYKFSRLFEMLDLLCDNHIIDGDKIFAQTGVTNYKSCNYKCVDMIDMSEFNLLLKDAEYIICHAGVGTIINCLLNNKKVIVVPRLNKYNEHIDDHQVEITKSFVKNGYIMEANSYEELEMCIKNIHLFKPNKFVSNNKKINDLIVDYIMRY